MKRTVADSALTHGVADEDDEWALPEGVAPFLEDEELYSDHTAAGIALLWAPHPFNRRFGRTRRVLDVPLVNSWFQEHVPSGCVAVAPSCGSQMSTLCYV